MLREKSLHVIINFSTRARTELKGGGLLVTERETDAMETEAATAAEVTNAYSLIAEEGPAAGSSAASPPTDDEVILL